MRTSIAGWRAWKPARRGISQRVASVGSSATVNRPTWRDANSRSVPWRIWSKPRASAAA